MPKSTPSLLNELADKATDGIYKLVLSASLTRELIHFEILEALQTLEDRLKNNGFHELKEKVRKFMRDHPGCLNREIETAFNLNSSMTSKVVCAIRAEWRPNDKA